MFQNAVERIFREPFFPAMCASGVPAAKEWNPAVDIYDNGDNLVIKAEVPGVDKEDIQVDLKDRVLTLKGERQVDNEIEKDNFYRQERIRGSFQRAFTLNESLDPETIKAQYKDGVLTIEIPKTQEQAPRQITIH